MSCITHISMINNISSFDGNNLSTFVVNNSAGGGKVSEYQYDTTYCNAYDYRLSYLPVF